MADFDIRNSASDKEREMENALRPLSFDDNLRS